MFYDFDVIDDIIDWWNDNFTLFPLLVRNGCSRAKKRLPWYERGHSKFLSRPVPLPNSHKSKERVLLTPIKIC